MIPPHLLLAPALLLVLNLVTWATSGIRMDVDNGRVIRTSDIQRILLARIDFCLATLAVFFEIAHNADDGVGATGPIGRVANTNLCQSDPREFGDG